MVGIEYCTMVGIEYFLQGRILYLCLPTPAPLTICSTKNSMPCSPSAISSSTPPNTDELCHDLDDFFCTKGHDFLQEVYQQKLQEKITIIEKTDEGKQCPNCKKKGKQNTKTKTLAATHGHIAMPQSRRTVKLSVALCF